MDMDQRGQNNDTTATSRGVTASRGNGAGRVLLDYLNSEPVAVSIRGLRKSFGENQVLKGVDLEIESGETVVILGKSGTGKSVLLRHIIGLEKPDGGSITIGGEDINDPDFKKHHTIGMVFQSSALFSSFTVEENVALYLREHKVFDDDSRVREVVSSALSIVGLEEKEDIMPSMLSGGMKRRVAMARALVMNPDLILFDEPTSGLDPMMTRTIGDLIRDLKRRVAITQIVVTHDIDLAFYVADRIAILSDGRIIEVGTPEEIRRCENVTVKEFITPQFEQ